MINLLRQVYFFRDVAQLASAPRSGRGGRPFESDHPDQISRRVNQGITLIHPLSSVIFKKEPASDYLSKLAATTVILFYYICTDRNLIF